MASSIVYRKSCTDILDRVYQREATSSCLNSPARMARAGRNAEEIMIPKISVSCLGDYKRNVGYKTGSITFDYETKAFSYDRGISSSSPTLWTWRRRTSWTASRRRAPTA